MGNGTKRRRQQRVAAVGAQVEESIRQDAEDKKLQHVGSTELFQLDSKGGDVPTRLAKKQKLLKLQKDPLLASSRKFDAAKLNKGEVLAVKKLQQHQQQMQQPTESMQQQQQLTDKKKRKRKQEPATEIWCQDGRIKEDEQVQQLDEYVAPIIVKKLKQRKPVASTKYKVPTVEVAAAGQSYHPDFDTHQDVMAEAVAEELERREKTALLREPVSKGMSKETLQHINEESSDSEAASDSDDEDDPMKKARKVPKKVTRAQRNKRTRHKLMERGHQVRRSEKAIVKQINASRHILQDIVKSEKEASKKQELKKLQREQKLQGEPLVRVGGKYIKLDRTKPVSFSEELTGTFRTLKPKGHPLLDRFDSLHRRNKIVIGRPSKTHKAKVRIIEKK